MAQGPRRPVTADATRRRRDPVFLFVAMAVSATAFVGFTFTYFGPILRGDYPATSATVHLHGGSFLLWYVLLPLQAWLVRSRNLRVHRILGTASIGLATVMVVTGIVVLAVILHVARSSPFWGFMGLPIFASLALFALFYAFGIAKRRVPMLHKRYMLLASVCGLPAATFRIALRIHDGGPATWVIGYSLPVLFLLVLVALDAWRMRSVPLPYRWGVPLAIVAPTTLFLLSGSAFADGLIDGIAAIGSWLAPLR